MQGGPQLTMMVNEWALSRQSLDALASRRQLAGVDVIRRKGAGLRGVCVWLGEGCEVVFCQTIRGGEATTGSSMVWYFWGVTSEELLQS